jgi:hypothetical protein
LLILLHLADLMHPPAAAGAFETVGLDHPFKAGQVLGQVTAMALGGRRRAPRCVVGGSLRRLLRLGLGDGRLELFEGQLPFICAQLLRSLAMNEVVELGHQMLKALDDGLEAGRFGLETGRLVLEFTPLAQQRGDSFTLVLRKGRQVYFYSGRHAPSVLGNDWNCTPIRPSITPLQPAGALPAP